MGDWGIDRKIFDFPGTSGYLSLKQMRGSLAESWECPDLHTIVFHIRKGVKFQDKPPANGRELTADDVVWNYNRDKKSPFIDKIYMNTVDSIKALDKYTVEMKMNVIVTPMRDSLRGVLDMREQRIIAPESVGASGAIEDWRKCVGTGPWILEDWIPDSVVSLKRNPNYWGYDELHPQNQLPYADAVKILIITDRSTYLAGLRSGKIDRLDEIEWQDSDSLKKTSPELMFRMTMYASPRLFKVRFDKPPFSDLRVRQAVSMAGDRLTIAKTFYGGYARPAATGTTDYHGDAYTSWEKLPNTPKWTTISPKEVLGYNPEKAKKLLAEAGYPNGFKTSIVTTPIYAPGLPEVFQSYLKAIGIEPNLRYTNQLLMMQSSTVRHTMR